VSAQQKPLELILARNLIAALSTPAFLADTTGDIVFFNESASVLLGRRFEETGPIKSDEWRTKVGPTDGSGAPIGLEDLPVTRSLRRGVAGYARHTLRPSGGGPARDFEITGVPIVATSGGFRGAIVFFWASEDIETAEHARVTGQGAAQ
jgi:PAS domain-containing protein